MFVITYITTMVTLFLILSGILYFGGRKRQGKELFQATVGFVMFYVFCVLFIGLAPESMGY